MSDFSFHQGSNMMSLNGINGATGDYLMPEMTPSELSQIAQGDTVELGTSSGTKVPVRRGYAGSLGRERGHRS